MKRLVVGLAYLVVVVDVVLHVQVGVAMAVLVIAVVSVMVLVQGHVAMAILAAVVEEHCS